MFVRQEYVCSYFGKKRTHLGNRELLFYYIPIQNYSVQFYKQPFQSYIEDDGSTDYNFAYSSANFKENTTK